MPFRCVTPARSGSRGDESTLPSLACLAIPAEASTRQAHTQVTLDGTSFNGWCGLIACTGTHVIDWQWTAQEELASWAPLLAQRQADCDHAHTPEAAGHTMSGFCL